MSILDSITRQCVQDIVYWPFVSVDGFNRETFGTPVPLKGRWEGSKEIVMNDQGEEVLSIARAWVLQDVTEGGYMYLGTTDDAAYNADPKLMDKALALRIIAFTKLPALGSTTEFLRKAHMNVSRSATI